MDNKFKDNQGRFRTLSLFLEPKYKTAFAIYTLKDQDHKHKNKKYLSIKKLYLEVSDPTEYAFAIQYFDSWQHWLKICDSPELRPHIEQWRSELEVKLRSKGVRRMIELSDGTTKDANAAAKYLADKGWDKRKAGAPSKEEKIKQRKISSIIRTEVDDDWERIQTRSLVN